MITRDITVGARFGRLLVVSLVSRSKNRQKIWECLCDCGATRQIRADSLRRITRSCGCLQRESVTTHGMSKSAEYGIWTGILDRSLSPSIKDADNYCRRGITVSDEWASSFAAFYRDVGPRPSSKHSIERIDNNKGYCKENCKWATALEQHNNKRTNVRITVNGKSLTSTQWSRILGGSDCLIRNRLRQGWTPEKSVTTPLLKENLL